MARTLQMTQVGKRKIELSNLEKVLWPEDGVLKAESIAHYLGIAPTILAHINGRPLSLVRFPDGIDGESFFQKNRPKYCSEWMDHEKIGDDGAEGKQIDYVIASDDASLVWLANHAAIELHHIHCRRPHFDKPDYFVFDLDPPEGYPFPQVVDLAFELKEHLEAFGYHCFCKTTGRKGVHVVLPLESRYDFDTVFETAKALAQPFVRARKTTTTLEIRKDKRPDKVLIDVYRNRPAQTIVAPYSLRGSPGATVSMPLTWEELETLEDPRVHNVHTARDTLLERGDPWEPMAAFAVRLHTDRTVSAEEKRDLAKSRTYKTPAQLSEYEKKRSFDRTPEPGPELEAGEGNAFVVSSAPCLSPALRSAPGKGRRVALVGDSQRTTTPARHQTPGGQCRRSSPRISDLRRRGPEGRVWRGPDVGLRPRQLRRHQRQEGQLFLFQVAVKATHSGVSPDQYQGQGLAVGARGRATGAVVTDRCGAHAGRKQRRCASWGPNGAMR